MSTLRKSTIPFLLIVGNMFLFAMVLESAYFIQDFRYNGIFLSALLPAVLVMAITVGFKEKNLRVRVASAIVFLGAAYFFLRTMSNFSVGAIVESVDAINLSMALGEDLIFEDFEPIIRILIVAGSFILSGTLYIFPYNLMILDMGLLVFLWAVDYHKNNFEYVRLFLPLWIFSVFFYRNTLLDGEVKHLRVNKPSRFLQMGALTLVVLLGSSFVDVNRPGRYNDVLFDVINNRVTQSVYLSGNRITDFFDLARTGYNDSSTRLGGNITMNQEIAMRATGVEPIYLRGAVKTEYTGESWLRPDILYQTGGRVENPKVMSMNRITGGDSDNLRVLEIRPGSGFTSTVFSGTYTRDVVFNNNLAFVYYNRDYSMFTSHKTVINNYRITYHDEEIMKDYLRRLNTRSDPDYLIDAALGNVQDEHLRIPESVTQRTRDFAYDLIGGAMNLTHVEKADRITAFLKENYEYTLEPGDLPEGQDFVDYFLFENPTGYCVHYATALTMLLRSVGVSARYVEGFKMSNEVENGVSIIRNSDAHAWTEVLVDEENDLWLIFDATGTPRELIYDDGPGEEDPGDEDPDDDEETPLPLDPQFPEDGDVPRPDSGDANGGQGSAGWGFFMIVPLLLGGFYALKRWKTNKLMKQSSLKPYFNEINKLLGYLYERREVGENYLEFAGRIRNRALRDAYQKLVEAVYQEIYGGKASDYALRQELYNQIYDEVKEIKGEYFYYTRRHLI